MHQSRLSSFLPPLSVNSSGNATAALRLQRFAEEKLKASEFE